MSTTNKPNIAISGRSGSGKTTIAEYLAEQHNYYICKTGQLCRNVSKMLFHSESKTILNKVTDAMKAIDENVWLQAALQSAPRNRPLIFDSVRFKSDYQFLHSQNFVFLRVEAPLDICISRLQIRGQEFQHGLDDLHESETSMAILPHDLTIINSELSLEELFNLIEGRLFN